MKSPATAKVAADDIAKATGTSFGDDPIAAIMSKYDKDGNGTFDVNEVRSIVYDVKATENQNSMLKKFVGILVVMILATLIAMFGVSFAAGIALKETQMVSDPVNGATMKTTGGAPVTVSVTEQVGSLFDLPASTMPELEHLQFLSGVVDMSTHATIADYVQYTAKIAGVYLTGLDQKLHIKTTGGDKMIIDGTAKTGTVAIDGVTYPLLAERPVDVRRKLGRRGGGGGGFGGSFSLSSGGNRCGND